MDHLLVIKKFMAMSMTIMLTLVILLSTSGSAMGQENRGARAGMKPLRHHNNKARPIPPNWRPSWMRNWEGRWKSITSPEQPSLSSKTVSCFFQRLRLRRP
jgi:hypothetical protein